MRRRIANRSLENPHTQPWSRLAMSYTTSSQCIPRRPRENHRSTPLRGCGNQRSLALDTVQHNVQWAFAVPFRAMSSNATPRRHHHLNREGIARAALELIDRDGLAGLSMRKLAATLHVGATNLYPYVPGREELLLEVIALLLSEVDLSERPGLGWEECVVSVGASLRGMAMRHPHAFPLVASARYDEWPLIDYSRRVEHLFSVRDFRSSSYLRWQACSMPTQRAISCSRHRS